MLERISLQSIQQLVDSEEPGYRVIWAPVFMGIGIGIYFALFEEPTWQEVIVGLTTAGVISSILIKLGFRFMGYAVLIACLGFTCAKWRTESVAAPVLQREIGPVMVEGTVYSVDHQAGNRVRLTLADLRVSRMNDAEAPAKIRVTVRTGGDAVQPLDRVKVLAMLMPPSAPVAPGAFDYSRQVWFSGLGGVGYAVGPVSKISGLAGTSSIRGHISKWRDQLILRLENHVDGDAGAVAIALMTGARSLISEKVQEEMRIAGLAHLLAISGLHIGLVAGTVMIIFRSVFALVPFIALRYPVKKYAAVAGIMTGLFYLLITGATIPTQRAFAMAGIALVAVMIDRMAITMRLVAIVALAMLMVMPEALLGVSFQMSFAAVVALVAFYEAMRRRNLLPGGTEKPMGLLWRYFWGVALTSLIAGVATGYIAAFHFNRLPSYGLLSNLFAVPIVALWVMPAAILTFVLLPFGLEEWGLTLMLPGIKLMLSAVAEIASWPQSYIPVAAMPVSSYLVVIIGGLWLCLWRASWRYLGIAVIAIGLFTGASATPPDVYLNEDGQLFAVRTKDGSLLFSNGRRDRMAADVWRRRSGIVVTPGRGLKAQDKTGQIVCDALACHYRPDGVTVISFVSHAEAFSEDCALVPIVISKIPAFQMCNGPMLVIDRFDFWRSGSHAVWLQGRGRKPAVKTVADYQGKRPWSRYLARE